MIRNVWEMFSDPAYALALDFAGVKVPCTACGRPIPDRSAPSWFSWADDIWSNPPAILHGGLYWAIRDDALDTVTSRIGNLLTEPTRFASFRHFGNGQTKPLLNYRGPGYHTVVNTRRIALRFPTYTGPKAYCNTCGRYTSEISEQLGVLRPLELLFTPDLVGLPAVSLTEAFALGGLSGLYAFEQFVEVMQDLDLGGVTFTPVGSVTIEGT